MYIYTYTYIYTYIIYIYRYRYIYSIIINIYIYIYSRHHFPLTRTGIQIYKSIRINLVKDSIKITAKYNC